MDIPISRVNHFRYSYWSVGNGRRLLFSSCQLYIIVCAVQTVSIVCNGAGDVMFVDGCAHLDGTKVEFLSDLITATF